MVLLLHWCGRTYSCLHSCLFRSHAHIHSFYTTVLLGRVGNQTWLHMLCDAIDMTHAMRARTYHVVFDCLFVCLRAAFSGAHWSGGGGVRNTSELSSKDARKNKGVSKYVKAHSYIHFQARSAPYYQLPVLPSPPKHISCNLPLPPPPPPFLFIYQTGS